MSVVDLSHVKIVQKGLAGQRPVDEQTFASLAVLSERLKRLKNLDSVFSSVKFSPDVKKLLSRKKVVAVS